MNSEGSGHGLQIHGGLASQWFKSTFCAFVFALVRGGEKEGGGPLGGEGAGGQGLAVGGRGQRKSPAVGRRASHGLPGGGGGRCGIRRREQKVVLHAGLEPATFGS